MKNNIELILTLQDKNGDALNEAKKLAQQYYNKYILQRKKSRKDINLVLK